MHLTPFTLLFSNTPFVFFLLFLLMDPHQSQPQQQDPHPHHPQQPPQNDQEISSGGSGSNKSSFLCRQSSTRWTPTSDQIRILKDLYYNNGVRSPSAEQIQKISARLRQYGKIEGKNVFYWFQNHKARERQKKRFAVETMVMQQRPPTTNNTPLTSPGISTPSSPSSNDVFGVGQIGNNMGYGPVVLERSFRDCSMSPGGCSNVGGGSIKNHMGWVSGGVDHHSYPYPYPFLDRTKPIQFFKEDYSPAVLETLPLFPMHGHSEDGTGFCSTNSSPSHDNWCGSEDEKRGSRTSLELRLNSYGGGN